MFAISPLGAYAVGRFSKKFKTLSRGSASGSDIPKQTGAEQQSEKLSIRAALSSKLHRRGHIAENEALEKESSTPPRQPSVGHSGNIKDQYFQPRDEIKTPSPWEEAQQKVLQNQELKDIFDTYEKELLGEENQDDPDISHRIGRVVRRRLEIIEEEGKITLAHHAINVEQNIKKGFAIMQRQEFCDNSNLLLQRTITAQDDAIEGFNQVSKILIRFRVMEDLYFESPQTSGGSVQTHPRDELEQLVRAKTIGLYSEILEYQIRLAVYLSRKKTTRLFRNLTALLRRGQEIRERMINSERAQLRDRLDKLPYPNGAAFNSNGNQHGDCLKDTRVDLLENVLSWAHAEGNENIFWLKGVAGTGKSTIAHTVASTLFSQGHLTACHHICTAIGEQPGIPDKNLSFQWQKLLYQPLEKMKEDFQPFLVIDALDECESGNLDEIIRILTRINNDTPGKQIFKIFITSRPETAVRFGFQQANSVGFCELVLDQVSRDVVQQDIRALIDYQQTDYSSLLPICRYLESSLYPTLGLEIMLDAGGSVSNLEEIDRICLQVLKSFVKDVSKESLDLFWQNFREIVGSILVLFEPFNVASLSGLLDIKKDEVSLTLDPLHSILEIPENIEQPVKVFHQSFRDFLVREKRSEIAEQDGISESNFHVNEEDMHRILASKCLQAMSKTLKKNICQAPHAGISLSDIDRSDLDHLLPKYAQYSCCHWVYHLEKSRRAHVFMDEVSSFLRTHLLHWLEALSLLGKGPESIKYIKTLRSLFVEESSELLALLMDIKRIALQNMPIIESAPLQVYSSALIFAPDSSIVRNIFQPEEVVPLSKLPRVYERWNSLLQRSIIPKISSWPGKPFKFSVNGEFLAMACKDGIQIWDVESGTFLYSFEVLGKIVRMEFSPDNRKLAVVCDPKGLIRLLDISTGILQHELKGPGYRVRFSPNGMLLASIGRDSYMLWNVASGSLVHSREFLKIGIDEPPDLRLIKSISFSPDSKLAVYSTGTQAHIIDANSGNPKVTLFGHTQEISDLAFSHSGKLIASGSSDGTVNLWDSSTGKLQHAFKNDDEHTDLDEKAIHTVAFSPDDRLVLAGSSANVKVWDTAASGLRYSLSMMKESCDYVSILPDGKLLAVEYSKVVEIYDSRTGDLLKTIYHDTWDSPSVQSTRFLPDCSSISIALNTSIDLWDLSPGFEQVTHSELDRVDAVAISMDGTLGASGAYDYSKTGKIWNMSKEVVVRNLMAESCLIARLKFSPDKRRLLSFDSGSLMLWDTSTGRKVSTLRPQGKSRFSPAYAHATTFPPNSQILSFACPGMPKELQKYLWNTNTGALSNLLRYPFNLYSKCLSVIFSPDSKIVATAARSQEGEDSRVLLWDTESGSLIYNIQKEVFFPWLEFSPDGKTLAYAFQHGVELCQLEMPLQPEPEDSESKSRADGELKSDIYNLNPWESAFNRAHITISRDRRTIAFFSTPIGSVQSSGTNPN
ncbi:hypothetical protein N7488_004669 [Penicillium malachiteum]|nr:hypothetical protein N7488_004669 [Penicillium malachiteum]